MFFKKKKNTVTYEDACKEMANIKEKLDYLIEKAKAKMESNPKEAIGERNDNRI